MKDLTNIEAFNYPLPQEKIALYPCEKRDESKLLIYKDKHIQEDIFKHISQYINENNLLVFNNSKVIQARLQFKTAGGATVEIFCLEPISPSTIHSIAFESQAETEWMCYIGNNKRFKNILSYTFEYQGEKGILNVERIAQTEDAFRVKFTWSPPHLTFAEIIELVGHTPLPPYIKRIAENTDKERYQTIYAQENGSVAAPTAGLHFSKEVLNNLKEKNIETEQITLHVGAGTFKPVNEEYAENHLMHTEQILLWKTTLENLIKQSDKQIIAVGTTSTRALESIYWIGVKMHNCIKQQQYIDESLFHLSQWEVYENKNLKPINQAIALRTILDYMNGQHLDVLHLSTSIMITPYYHPQIVKGLITNFHQPKSTLLLLIAAFVGEDWKNIYDYALNHHFRFLSYGDACLFI